MFNLLPRGNTTTHETKSTARFHRRAATTPADSRTRAFYVSPARFDAFVPYCCRAAVSSLQRETCEEPHTRWKSTQFVPLVLSSKLLLPPLLQITLMSPASACGGVQLDSLQLWTLEVSCALCPTRQCTRHPLSPFTSSREAHHCWKSGQNLRPEMIKQMMVKVVKCADGRSSGKEHQNVLSNGHRSTTARQPSCLSLRTSW